MTTTTIQQVSAQFTADSVVINAAGNPGETTSPTPPISGGAYGQWSADGFVLPDGYQVTVSNELTADSTILHADSTLFTADRVGIIVPAVAQPKGVPASLGLPVTSRQFSFKEMAIRAWGSEWSAPDHRVYEFQNGRGFDSTDRGFTGIYRQPTP